MNIVSNGHCEAVLFNKGDNLRDLPSHLSKVVRHVANRPFFGTVMRIYACGFNEGKRVLAIVNPKTWQVIHTLERTDLTIPDSIQG